MQADPPTTSPHASNMTAATEQHIVKAWMLACDVDIDAAAMIAEQHHHKTISAEQTVTALLCIASASAYMNSCSQLYS